MRENEKRLRAHLSRAPGAWVQCTSTSNECLGGCRSMREHDAYVHGVLFSELESLRPLVALHEDMTRMKREAEQERDVARDAALEEAKRAAASEGVSDNKTALQRAASARANTIVERIDALKSQPAERYLRETEVREVLLDAWQQATQEKGYRSRAAQLLKGAARCLGVDLDAEGACDDASSMHVVCSTKPNQDARNTCTCTGTCRGPDGLGAGWKCALNNDVHTEHCCQRHGCKYADAACTVTSGKHLQSFPCAECEISPLVCDCGHGVEVHGEEDWAPGCRERGCECRTYRRSVVSP